ncbi:hypothetical protein [Rathayibacter rathayi]|uniref:hypothetical protein n=1 Tax=Rathayibacter rathayi TaxID=33887 RepID=UPI0015E1D03E|nr:hypothetical protein [Rathayibacter rathayi]
MHALDPAGLSPVTDAQPQAYRDGHNGAFAAAGDWMTQNWEYIAGGAMVVAGGVLMATGVGGPIGAGLIGAGIDVIIQKATTGSVNWAQTALTAVTGGLGSSMTAARLGAAGISGLKAAVASEAASGAASGAAGDAYAYATAPGPHTLDGFLQASGGGALAGAAMGAGGPLLGHGLTGAGRAGKNLLGKEADALTPDITTPSEPLNAVKPTARPTDIDSYKLSKTVQKQTRELQNNGDFAPPYNESRLMMQLIADTGEEVQDRETWLRKFVANGTMNGHEGRWELVLDEEAKIIYHYWFGK